MLIWTVYFCGALFDIMTEQEMGEMCLIYNDIRLDLRRLVAVIG